MRLLYYCLLLILLSGFQFPSLSLTNTSYHVQMISTLYGGNASPTQALGQAISAKKCQEKPSLTKAWKKIINQIHPHPKTDDDLIAAILAFFLGIWGAHKFYQGNVAGGFVMLGISIFGILLILGGYIAFFATLATSFGTVFPIAGIIIIIIGMLCLIATSIWSLIDFVRILAKM